MDDHPHDSGNEDRVRAFGLKHRTGLVTLVFTDLVGDTQLFGAIGRSAGLAFLG